MSGVCAGEMVAIRREDKEEYLTAPDLVGEVAVLTDCLPELKTRSAPLSSPAQQPCADQCQGMYPHGVAA